MNRIRLFGWIVAVLLICLPCGVFAQEETEPQSTTLSPASPPPPMAEPDTASTMNYSPTTELAEVLVTPSRSGEAFALAPRAVSVVTGEEIYDRMSRTVPEALRFEEGVMVQRTNLGGGAPFIRGLMGNQVLYLVDGIRLNNSTYRSGPNQYLNTLDPLFVDRIEVVRGPSSVLYGSDALGGAINVITVRRDQFDKGFGLDGRFMGRFSTADRERLAHASTQMNAGKVMGIAASANSRSFGDIDPGGEDEQTQAPFGYVEDDVAANLDFHIGPRVDWLFSGQLVNMNQVPNYDPSNPKNEYDPQERRLGYSKLIFHDLSDYLDRVEFWGSFQRQTEGRRKIDAANPAFETKDLDHVDTVGAGVQIEMPTGKWARFIFGSEYYRDEISSERELVDLVTDDATEQDPQLPDGATYSTSAAYLEARFTPVDWWRFVPGVRYSYVQPDFELDDPVLGAVTVDEPITDVTWSVHTMFTAAESHNFILGASRGFRAPGIDDLSKLGSEDGRYDVPNSDLEPETMIQYEAGYRLAAKRAFFSLFGYYSQIADLIVRKPTDYNGATEINGDAVNHNENVGEAFIYGWEASSRLVVLEDLIALGGTAHYTFGQNETDEEPLRRIPPLLGTGWLKLGADPLGFETAMEAASKQDRLSQADKDDVRIGPDGTPAFLVWHFRLGLTVNDWIETVTSVENAFDRKYKFHGSGPLEAGRNFKTQVAIKF
ncbi:MAG: TonB-dependent receptor [Deltaproteobacteria bacterium]|nr:TonB-dependent receptor [Deltaproteobacteria bacterium]